MAVIARAEDFRLEDSSLTDALKTYADFTHRTILHAYLPKVSIKLGVTAKNATDAAEKIELALKREKIAVLKDGEQFAVVVPEERKAEALQVLKDNPLDAEKSSKERNANSIRPATIDFPTISVQQAIDFYWRLAGASGLEENPDFPIPPVMIQLQTETGITQSEAIHAMDVVFALNGFKMEKTADGKVKPAPLPIRKK